MTIVDEIAEAIRIEWVKLGDGCGSDQYAAAQAAWDVVKAKMLGDDAVAEAIARFEYGYTRNTRIKAALTAAIKKLEE